MCWSSCIRTSTLCFVLGFHLQYPGVFVFVRVCARQKDLCAWVSPPISQTLSLNSSWIKDLMLKPCVGAMCVISYGSGVCVCGGGGGCVGELVFVGPRAYGCLCVSVCVHASMRACPHSQAQAYARARDRSARAKVERTHKWNGGWFVVLQNRDWDFVPMIWHGSMFGWW